MRQSTAEILRRRWPELGLIGAAHLLAQILTYGVIAGLLVPLLLGYQSLSGGMRAPRLDGGSRELVALVAGAAGLAGVAVVPILLAATAFMLAGLLGAAARLYRGEPVGFLAFWTAGALGFWRALGVVLPFALGAVGMLVLLVLLLGPWGALLWGLLAIPAGLYGLLYPVYLATVKRLGTLQAFGHCGRALVRDPGEAALASLLVVGFALGYAVVLGVLLRLGFLGHVGFGFVQLLAVPGFTLLLVGRVERSGG
ncbi:MAG TPA: hypothetical protein VK191_16450 [Symbiobacteriaceae bacterium]|nr:hypothetical protein [Symbiobacteriaceae bacterium]